MMKPKIAPALLCMLLFVLAACVDYNDAVAPVTLNVTVERPASFTQGADLAGKSVTLTLNGNQQTTQTDAQGKATFVGIAPDVYTISTSWQVSAAEYAAYTGDDVATDGASVTGSVNAQVVSADVSLTLPTHVAVNRSVVIGKLYYAGSKDMNNKNYLAGRYIELFNQSDSVVDVAGMYVALLESESTPAYTLANLHEKFADSPHSCRQAIPGSARRNGAVGEQRSGPCAECSARKQPYHGQLRGQRRNRAHAKQSRRTRLSPRLFGLHQHIADEFVARRPMWRCSFPHRRRRFGLGKDLCLRQSERNGVC